MRKLKKYTICSIILFLFITINFDSYAKTSATLIVNSAGRVLYEKNAKKKLYPASLTKLMTAYLVFEALKHKKLTFNTKLTTSRRASRMPATKLGLRRGEEIRLRDAVMGMLIKSFNDVAVVLAEGVAGSEKRFAKIMTKRARQLGMTNTRFENASGLHHRRQVTTAYDMAKLTMALMRDFPEYYHLFSINSFLIKRSFYRNTNYVKKKLPGVEGMKTGYTSKAGWNIVTTAKRRKDRLIGVILGGSTHLSRDLTMIKLMNKYFAKLKRLKHIPSPKHG